MRNVSESDEERNSNQKNKQKIKSTFSAEANIYKKQCCQQTSDKYVGNKAEVL